MEKITTDNIGQLMFEATIHTHAVARLDDCGHWVDLEYFSDYHDADAALDRWADKYPNAWIDVTRI